VHCAIGDNVSISSFAVNESCGNSGLFFDQFPHSLHAPTTVFVADGKTSAGNHISVSIVRYGHAAFLFLFFLRGLPPSLPFSSDDLAFLGLVRLPSNLAASEIVLSVTM